ncbi:hypothetical protein CFC21_098967 [Triticum aestivum]|uniref:Uncharacterized protein n=2 Tax=Triticum aestivum TaxID=4565 RepID=A0A3B6RN69_WHEAT|nr:hypothetical protein CFC21_098967 [Triticum aestivum]
MAPIPHPSPCSPPCSSPHATTSSTTSSIPASLRRQAQALTGQTTKWYACCTIEPVPDDEIDPGSNQYSRLEEYPEDESDCESSVDTGDEDMENTKFLQPHTHVISFQKRQALVTYLENNKADITVFGFTLDRSYLHTITVDFS